MDILAVIVTYNPDIPVLEEQLHVLARIPSVRTLIVDNCSAQVDISSKLLALAGSGTNEVVILSENRGLGTAHNLGIQRARVLGARYCLILDQDSVPQQDMIQKLHRIIESMEARGDRVAAVGPRYRNPLSGHLSYFVQMGYWGWRRIHPPKQQIEPVQVSFLVSSGMLISMSALEEIGLMNEELFIDHVDTEWCFRAKEKGYALYGVPQAFMEHALGDETVRIWLGRWRYLPVHTPMRQYYLYRNTIALSLSHRLPPSWYMVEAARLLALAVLYGICVAPRLQRICFLWKGVRDGIAHHLGRNDTLTY